MTIIPQKRPHKRPFGVPCLSESLRKDLSRYRVVGAVVHASRPCFFRPMTDRPGLDFSFSGLKTFARNTLLEHEPLTEQ